jgi:hypothetical protein
MDGRAARGAGATRSRDARGPRRSFERVRLRTGRPKSNDQHLAAILHESARARLTSAWMHLQIPEWSGGIWPSVAPSERWRILSWWYPAVTLAEADATIWSLSWSGASTHRHVVHARYDEHAEKAHGGAFSAQQDPDFWRQFHAMTQNSGSCP